jgi:hypothetical protein
MVPLNKLLGADGDSLLFFDMRKFKAFATDHSEDFLDQYRKTGRVAVKVRRFRLLVMANSPSVPHLFT